MKKSLLILAFAFIGLSSCDRDKDCNCIQQKYERTAVYKVGDHQYSGTPVSSTPWEKKTDTKPSNEGCDSNGKVRDNGSQNAQMIPGTDTYKVTEFEYRVSCN